VPAPACSRRHAPACADLGRPPPLPPHTPRSPRAPRRPCAPPTGGAHPPPGPCGPGPLAPLLVHSLDGPRPLPRLPALLQSPCAHTLPSAAVPYLEPWKRRRCAAGPPAARERQPARAGSRPARLPGRLPCGASPVTPALMSGVARLRRPPLRPTARAARARMPTCGCRALLCHSAPGGSAARLRHRAALLLALPARSVAPPALPFSMLPCPHATSPKPPNPCLTRWTPGRRGRAPAGAAAPPRARPAPRRADAGRPSTRAGAPRETTGPAPALPPPGRRGSALSPLNAFRPAPCAAPPRPPLTTPGAAAACRHPTAHLLSALRPGLRLVKPPNSLLVTSARVTQRARARRVSPQGVRPGNKGDTGWARTGALVGGWRSRARGQSNWARQAWGESTGGHRRRGTRVRWGGTKAGGPGGQGVRQARGRGQRPAGRPPRWVGGRRKQGV
jgi:hypothetical protein